jgi:hypothetical protein
MTTPRDVTQDIDPAPEPEHSGRALRRKTPLDPEDEHIGAREDQVVPTPAPAGKVFEDEPKQG